ncbi:hypothetical protein PVAND_012148 [Polypedilum vanderplanki]|uniref:C2H2-type domain-containing protein n=1 Tax=Polypedilum vanderplanki TaxID=319348 RepID=A0A9J6CLK0_POLVA|nr:hypothetical protein PVAND_012148 [Polypedilum vanderplanki]
MESKQEFPTFCYNVKNIQMIAPTQIAGEDKIQYIATQPFTTYGQSYALVNPVQLAGAQNGQIVINKPISANTISNISFKCDVCSQIFSHLTLLNQHKRTHNQDESHSDTVTVVTQQPNIIQAQNLITESGQNLGIQIVATESLEPAQIHLNDQIGIVQQSSSTSTKGDKHKCITCGGLLKNANAKRKGPKLIRCDTCIKNDSFRPAQFIISPDGDIKLEVDNLTSHNVIQIPAKGNAAKKKNVTTVTKCTTCNGTGVVIVTDSNTSSTTTTTITVPSTNKTSSTRTVTTSPQKTVSHSHHQQHNQNSMSPPPLQHHHPVQHHAPPQNQSAQSQNDKPFSCNICGGKFSRYSSLWSHKKLHSGEKNYRCELCNSSFAKAVYLKNHMRIHSGEKPYSCKICGMTFSQSPHLKNHERTHTGERPYVCQICDKGFARHATLWNHRRIHTGEKPYKCERCSSSFSQAAHLKNHEKVHLGIKPYKCSICGGSFSDRFALKRHQNIHQKYGQTAPISEDTEDMMDDEMMMKEEEEDEDDSSIKDEMTLMA